MAAVGVRLRCHVMAHFRLDVSRLVNPEQGSIQKLFPTESTLTSARLHQWLHHVITTRWEDVLVLVWKVARYHCYNLVIIVATT